LADSDVHDRFIVWSSLLNALDSIWGFGVLFALACAGVVMLWDQRRTLWPIAAMAVVYAISLAMFFIFARYRMMLVTLLVPLAAAALTQLAERIRQPSALLAAALAAALAIGIIWLGDRSIPPRIKGTNDYNRAITAASRGQIDRAIQLYQRAITANPQLSAAYQNLGLLLVDRGDVERATQRLTEAVRLEPGDAVARVNLGMTLARRGSLSSAIEQFETAMRIDPASTAAQWNLAMALHASGREGEAHDILGKIASSTSSDPFARRAAEFLKIESTQPSSQPSSRK
jgi:tetratricopeptide (TPR) repeat protein